MASFGAFGSGGGGGGSSGGVSQISSVATGPITLAVTTGGSDTPSPDREAFLLIGDYSAFPFATVDAALAALPRNLSKFYHKVNIGAGTFAGFTVQGFQGSGTLDVKGTLAAASPTTGAQSGTAGSGTSSTAIKKPTAAANWTVGELRGKTVRITGGGGYYADTQALVASNLGPCLRRIKDNTIDTLSIDALTGLDSTTTFEIMDAATIVTACGDLYQDTLSYCAGVISNANRTLLRDIKAADVSALFGVLAQVNKFLEMYNLDVPVSLFCGIGAYDTDNLTLSDSWLHGGSAAHADLYSGDRLSARRLVVDNARLQASYFTRAALSSDAKSCTGNALKVTSVDYAIVDLNANSCTATPLVARACAHLEPGSLGIVGTNAGTTYGADIGNGGQYFLTGATLAGSSGNQLLIEGEDNISWTALSAGTWARRGTFAYWGVGSTRWAGKVSGYQAETLEKTADYTLSLDDCGRVLKLNSAVGRTFTLPNSFPEGWCCTVIQTNTAQATFAPASGATLVNVDSDDKTAGRWALVTLVVNSNSGTNAQWVLGGRTG